MMDTRFQLSPKCSQSIGCKIHRAWETSFIRTVNHQSTGFTDLSLQTSNKGHLPMQNKIAKQILCHLANDETLNKVMKLKAFPPKILEELDEAECKVDKSKDSICYGMNYGMGTRKICVRLRLN